MVRKRTNAGDVNTSYSVELTFDEYSAALRQLPPKIAHWIEYEAGCSYNPVELLEVKRENWFMTWDEIFEHIKKDSRMLHRDAFGGVHPQLDTPRRVW